MTTNHASLIGLDASDRARLNDPEEFKAAFLRYLESLPIVMAPPITYLLTWTYNAKSGTKSDWYSLLKKQLGSKLFLSVESCIEHIDTNIHCHSLVTTKHPNLSRSKFTAWCKKHPLLDIRKVKPTSQDESRVGSYVKKENPSFTDLIKFADYYDVEISPDIQQAD